MLFYTSQNAGNPKNVNFGKDGRQTMVKIRLINSWKSWLWDQYLSKDMKWKFGKSLKLLKFQVRESPAPLNIPTPTPIPWPLRSGRSPGPGPGRGPLTAILKEATWLLRMHPDYSPWIMNAYTGRIRFITKMARSDEDCSAIIFVVVKIFTEVL